MLVHYFLNSSHARATLVITVSLNEVWSEIIDLTVGPLDRSRWMEEEHLRNVRQSPET